ncbi:MAG: divalent cation tolerance protein CutA [Gammaproteobacteria bacterium]|nr:divalent cation tolerance protein CutA [Gammaproteobacteria bacterium]
MENKHCIVLITTPDMETAQKIGDHLVEEKLAACANILGNIRSIFTWQNEVNDENEVLMIVKTRTDIFNERFVPAVVDLHPYDVPEIIALPISMGNKPYLDWIDEVTDG